MSTTPENAKAWIHVGLLLFPLIKLILTGFGIYIPNIADLPSDQILNFVTAGVGGLATAKLANSEPIAKS